LGLGVKLALGLGFRSALGLGQQLRLSTGLTFYISYVSTKPTTFSSCVTITLQEILKQGFKFKSIF